MIRVGAVAHVATMVDLQSFRDRAIRQLIGEPMGITYLAAVGDLPVAVGEYRVSPEPALAGTVQTSKEISGRLASGLLGEPPYRLRLYHPRRLDHDGQPEMPATTGGGAQSHILTLRRRAEMVRSAARGVMAEVAEVESGRDWPDD